MTIKASQLQDDGKVYYTDISIGELFCHAWADQLREYVAVWLKMRDGAVCLNTEDTNPLVFYDSSEFASNMPNYKLYTGAITIENAKG